VGRFRDSLPAPQVCKSFYTPFAVLCLPRSSHDTDSRPRNTRRLAELVHVILCNVPCIPLGTALPPKGVALISAGAAAPAAKPKGRRYAVTAPKRPPEQSRSATAVSRHVSLMFLLCPSHVPVMFLASKPVFLLPCRRAKHQRLTAPQVGIALASSFPPPGPRGGHQCGPSVERQRVLQYWCPIYNIAEDLSSRDLSTCKKCGPTVSSFPNAPENPMICPA
jgi:hypothetical protein